MKKALDEAVKAYDRNEVPIGAIVVQNKKVIGRGYNMTKTLHDATAHAELIAITAACNFLSSDKLFNCQLFVTAEPCTMCVGASVHARLNQIIYGVSEPKHGACGSTLDLFDPTLFHHQIQVIHGVMEEDAKYLLKLFFKNKRKASINKLRNR